MIEHTNDNLRSWWRVGIVVVLFICAVLTVVRAVVENHVSSLAQAVLYASLGFLMTPAMQRKTNKRALVRLRQAADANAGALP
jgi:Sec-independent protein secretion pathway component TatC